MNFLPRPPSYVYAAVSDTEEYPSVNNDREKRPMNVDFNFAKYLLLTYYLKRVSAA